MFKAPDEGNYRSCRRAAPQEELDTECGFSARAQLRRVFIYVRQADGHLCRPERHQIDYVGKGQIIVSVV